MSDREKIICMAMDAFRLCIGIRPRNFTPTEIARYVVNCATDCPHCDGTGKI